MGVADDCSILIGSVGDHVVQSGDCEMRVLVLGAGFGGLELTTRLSEEFGNDVEVVLDRPGRRLRLRFLQARRLLLHEYLSARGLRDRSEISLVMPLPVPIPPSPAASEALLEAFSQRNINWHPGQLIRELDPAGSVARFADGTELPFDLFLGVPTHHVPTVVAESGMTVDGWIPVNPLTLETSYPGVFAVGDVTSVGTPKAGVFSERQAGVAADRIISIIRGGAGTAATHRYVQRTLRSVGGAEGRVWSQPYSAMVRSCLEHPAGAALKHRAFSASAPPEGRRELGEVGGRG